VKALALALALVAALGGCMPRSEAPRDKDHNSRYALNWAGV